MADKRGPTLRAQWLGHRLRGIRESADLTLKDIADHLQRDPSTISRMEQGIHPARVPDVLAYLEVCRVAEEHRRADLVKLARDARLRGWWDRYANDFPDKLIDRIWLEANGREIRSFQAVVIPGLLQIPAYAEATIRAVEPDAPQSKVNRAVELRMTRQRALDRPGGLNLMAVLDEGALHRVVGDVPSMREQLDHLLDVAHRPSIEIAVLPWNRGAHASPDGNFEILLQHEPYPDVGYVDTAAGSIYVEGNEVEQFSVRFDRLHSHALGSDESAELIRRISDKLGE